MIYGEIRYMPKNRIIVSKDLLDSFTLKKGVIQVRIAI